MLQTCIKRERKISKNGILMDEGVDPGSAYQVLLIPILIEVDL